MGRAIYHSPYLLADIEKEIFKKKMFHQDKKLLKIL